MNEGALKAKVGETVRLYVGNGGPNLVASFHVIGEIFDAVYTEAGLSQPNRNVQTTLIPAGGATIVEMKMDVPGRFLLVDHSISRAMDKGALGVIEVTGVEHRTSSRSWRRAATEPAATEAQPFRSRSTVT